ncbi:MAG: hypothetical protein WCO19_01130 [Candidatus Saccharibacteria bacterium]
MRNNQDPTKSNKPKSLTQQRRRIAGALVVGAGLTGAIGFGAGMAVGAHGMVPEAVGTCVGPVTPDEVESGLGGLRNTLGTEKIAIRSRSGASVEAEAAKNLRERERLITSGMNDETVPVLLNGDTFTAENVAQGTCALQPGAQFTEVSSLTRKDTK